MRLSYLVVAGSVLIAPLVGSSPTRAEDFTGFYAGVNAGYAFGRDRQEPGGPSASSGAAASKGDPAGLPPSALTASQSAAMNGSRSERSRQR